MDLSITVKALAALAQESRLRAFRLLVHSGPDGLAAGEIARQLKIPHNTLSSHLTILSNAGLIVSHRESRSIIYQINFTGTRDLLAFLMQDCCRGQPELCEPLLDSLLPDCCATTRTPGEIHETPAR
jgi:DNA-binding transcriptional ArsR family regulator